MEVQREDLMMLLSLTALRYDKVRVDPIQNVFERVSQRLMEVDEFGWISFCIESRLCPECLWQLDVCPNCAGQGRIENTWCPHCDIHWAEKLASLASLT